MGEPCVLMILESVFPSPSGGGAESQVRTLAMALLARGQAVQVVTPMVSDGSQKASETVDGIPVTRIAYPKISSIGALILLFKLAVLLVARRNQYSVIHAHIAGNMAAVACLMGRVLKKPVLVKLTGMTEMRGGILDPAARGVARWRRWAIRHGQALQATSSRMAGMLTAAGFSADRILQLPNAVDTGRFVVDSSDAQGRRQELLGQRKLVGVFVGRLEEEKDVELLLRAWADQFAGRNDAALLVVGGGSLEEPLRLLARRLGLERHAVFVGSQTRVENYLVLADFALLTSRFEGLSNALLEYMGAGLPVVGSRISGTEDWVVEGRTGWLFAAGDRQGLAAALRAVDEETPSNLRRRGRQARELVERSASVDAVVKALMTTYAQLESSLD